MILIDKYILIIRALINQSSSLLPLKNPVVYENIFKILLIFFLIVSCDRNKNVSYRNSDDKLIAENSDSENINQDNASDLEPPINESDENLTPIAEPLPFDSSGSHGNYIRSISEDQWNPQSKIFDRAFDYLTASGIHIFNAALKYQEIQKTNEFSHFAQPGQSLSNIIQIMNLADYKFTNQNEITTSNFLEIISDAGGQVYDLPLLEQTQNSRQALVDFFNDNFNGNIPTGAIIVSCSLSTCLESEMNTHLAIVGDKNEFGEIMIYHNNWLTPNYLGGKRIPYMVTIKSLYEKLRPRQWMPTPWLYLLKDKEENSKIIDIASAHPIIANLDPTNSLYYIKIVLLPKIFQEVKNNAKIAHHYELSSGNQHINLFIEEVNWEICHTSKPLKELSPRLNPAGQINIYAINQLKTYETINTFFDIPFEFAPIEKVNGWVSALVYDTNRFWGGLDYYGPIWLDMNTVICDKKSTTH